MRVLPLLGAAAAMFAITGPPHEAAAQVNPDGSYRHEIPIELPLVASGMVPKLSFASSSQGGNGPLGAGWQLEGLPSISRTSYGEGIDFAGEDTYVGPSGRLVKAQANDTFFHGEQESFARFEPMGTCGDGPCTWTVRYPNGQVATYGGGSASAWASQNRGVRTWALASVVDPRGNSYAVTYSPADGEIYPWYITYDVGALSGGGTKFIWFDWEDRPDTNVSYATGTKVRRSKRLLTVKLSQMSNIVTEWRLSYGVAPGTGASRLTTLSKVSGDGTMFERTWTFTYDEGRTQVYEQKLQQHTTMPYSGYRWTMDVNGDGFDDYVTGDNTACELRVSLYNPATGFGTPMTRSVGCHFGTFGYLWSGDFNGDGRGDIAYRAAGVDANGVPHVLPQVRVYLGNSSGGFDSQLWGSTGWPWTLWGAADDTFTGDFDGDGKTDLATRNSSNNTWMVRRSTGSGFTIGAWSGTATWGPAGSRFVGDFDGDGRSDLASVVANPWRVIVLRSNGANFSPAVWAAGGQWNATKYTLVGDFNGDGKTDLVSRATINGAASLHLSTGSGLETFAVPTATFTGNHRQTGDFDGDGRTDFFECPSNNTTLGYRVYSRGTSFQRVPDSQGCEPSTETGAPLTRMTADLDGDGVTDAVSPWKTKIYTYRTVVPRDVLTDLRDGYPMADPVVSVRYTPAAQTGTAIHATDTQCGGGAGAVCGNPSTGGRLLVKSLTNRDGRGGVYRTDYEFWNGRYLPGRPGVGANLGFQSIIARNAQTFVHTATHFLQVRPFHGQIEFSRTYQPDDDPVEASPILFAETHNLGYAQYRCTEQGCVADSNPGLTGPRQIRASQVVTRTYELGVLLFEQRKHLVFDGYGNTAIVTSETWKDGVRLHTQSESKTFANRTSAPRAIGVPVSRRLWVTSPADPHLYEEYYYDDLAWGQLGSYLEQTRVRARRGGAAAPWEESQRAFDAYGNLVGETDARGLANSYEYSSDGRLLVAVTGPEGRVSYTHDYKTGLPIVALHENGVRVVTGYDSLQRMTSQRTEIAATGQLVRQVVFKGPSNGEWRSVCESAPATAAMTGSSGLSASAISQPPPSGDLCKTVYSDALGREFLELTPHASGQVAVSTIYGTHAQVERVSEPYFQGQNPPGWTIFSYDVLGRNTRVDAPDGSIARVEYNQIAPAPGAVRTRTVIEPMGGRRTIHEDDRELPFVIDDHGLVTRYGYDALGRVVSVTKNDGQVVAIGYDAMGNRDQVEDPNTGTTRFTFHTTPGVPSYGQLASETRPTPGSADATMLLTSSMEYDSWGRLAARTRSDGAVAAYVYDDAAGGGGRLVQESWDEGALHVEYRYQYDLLGRQVRREQSVSGALDDGTPVELDVAFESSFNARGRLEAIKYPDGQKAVYGYDAAGTIASVEYDDAKVSVVSRDVRGRAETIMYGNGLQRTDKSSPIDGRIVERRVQDGSGAAVFWRTYGFDGDGNATQIDDLIDDALSTEYQYDGAGRLQHATRADGRAFHYAHDAGGNLVGTTVFDADGNTVVRTRSVIAGTNRLADDGAGHTLTWSAAGHLLGHDQRTFAWSGDGQVTGVWRGDELVETTAYDHASHRLVTVQHLADGSYIVSYDTGGLYEVRQRVKGDEVQAQQTTSNLFLGTERVAAIVYGDASLEPGAPAVPLGPRYFHADLLGSVSVVTDGGGTVTSRAVYSPTGELDPRLSATGGERILYTGGELGAGTGLVTLGVRHYDPVLGVFISPDATVPDPLSALDWNPYLYARGNPMRYTDPSGRFPFLLIGIGFAIGFVIGGTEGGILTDPGKWMDASYLCENWNWGKAIVGGLVGAAAGGGYAALGTIPGSLLGVGASTAAQAAAVGGALETVGAYAAGERRVGRLAGHFGVGAVNGFMARTGFFGMASVGFRGAGTSMGRLGAAVVMYGGAMLCDSLVASGLRRTLDPDAPLEVSIFGVTYTKHADGVWTRRFSFAQAWRTLTGSVLLAAGEGPSYLADFTPIHRDRLYQWVERKTEEHGFGYGFAAWAETGLLLYEMGWIRLGIPSGREFASQLGFAFGAYMGGIALRWGNVTSEFEERVAGCDYPTHEEDAAYCRYP